MKIILFIILLFSSILYSESHDKYLIYFKDKDGERSNILNKGSEEYQDALNSLSQRSIDRRKKTLGNDLISFEDIAISKKYLKNIKLLGAEIIWELKWFNAVSCRIPETQISEIKKLIFVDRVEKVKTISFKRKNIQEYILSKTQAESDSIYNLDYGFSLTQNELSDIPTIHDLGYSGQNVLIGILDAGFAWKNHPSLSGADVLAEHDFVNGDSSTDDGDAKHGTSVFSIIGGFDEGWTVGPAYGAQYILAKTENINSESHVEEDNFAAAMEWMESLGVDVTTTSLGYNEFDDGEESYTYENMDGKTTIVTKASEIAFTKGVLTVTSAGNEGNKSWKYITAPADGFNTIAVGAVSADNVIAVFSSVGPTYDKRLKPEITTQGVNCYRAVAYSDGYSFGSGTSFAAPIASGITAQLLSAFPHLINTQMRRIIIESGDSPTEPDNSKGYGLLSAKRALEYPNLKEDNGSYILNKMFIHENIGESDSVFAAIYDPRSDMIPIGLMEKNNDYYSLAVLSYPSGTELQIQFYIKRSGSHLKLSNEIYKFIYGSLDITRFTDKIIPQEFKVYQNYPNPFNSSTTILVDLPEPANLELRIYDILGREVRTVFDGNKLQGQHYFFWNGNDNFGSRVASGVYIYRISSPGSTYTQKMILLN